MFGLAGTAGSDISQYGLRLCHDAWQRLAGITGQANLNSYEDEHKGPALGAASSTIGP